MTAWPRISLGVITRACMSQILQQRVFAHVLPLLWLWVGIQLPFLSSAINPHPSESAHPVPGDPFTALLHCSFKTMSCLRNKTDTWALETSRKGKYNILTVVQTDVVNAGNLVSGKRCRKSLTSWPSMWWLIAASILNKYLFEHYDLWSMWLKSGMLAHHSHKTTVKLIY